MRALIDTNVLMDFVGKRGEFFKAADKVFDICGGEKADGFVSAHSLMDLCYLVRKRTRDERIQMLHLLCDLYTVVETTESAIIAAVEREDFSDFEDSVVNQAAIKAGADCIVTRNQGDFNAADVKVVSPVEFIEMLGEKLEDDDPDEENE